ncbi:MAG: hypothetical protein D6727_08100 [Gammaproteobacteria bacterium]|nr:MAG: hypothetical protein D6727_08100 [Gammaproteobacteria bacterium]
MQTVAKTTDQRGSRDAGLACRRPQGGAALIVGLVLLMVLTILAIASMRTASLELLMAGNTQLRANAFQLAESGIEALLAQVESGAIHLQPVDGWEQSLGPTPVALGGLQGQYEARVRYMGSGPPWDGSSSDLFEFLHFQIQADGVTTSGGVVTERSGRARHVQGIYRKTARTPAAED